MDDEYTLITKILSGDTEAWHSFVETFSPRMRQTIARYVQEPEIARDLYISLLEKLKNGKLKKFDFRSTLATWLYTVARNHCRDYYRSTKGVRHLLIALEGMSPEESRFFKLYYVQGLSLQETFESMRIESGGSLQYLDIFEYHETIRKKIAGKKLGRLLDRLIRPSSEPIHLNTFGSAFAFTQEDVSESPALAPESYIDGKNLKTAIDNLRGAILQLPDRDQLILKLRFEHKRSAREICEILDLGNEKQVYRKLERLLDKLRSMLLDLGLPDGTYRELAEDIENICELTGVWDTHTSPGSGSVS